MQKAEALGFQFGSQYDYAREVAARPAEAGNETAPDHIFASQEDNRNRSSRSLGSRYCRGASRENHCDLATNQIGRQRRKSIVLAVCPAVFKRYILALGVTCFAEAFVERGH